MSIIEQRRSKRFELELPLQVVRSGADRAIRPGKTRNISSGGVCFTTDCEVELGGAIEYVIALSDPIQLKCIGKVLRQAPVAELGEEPPGVAVAATLERYEFQRSASSPPPS